VTGTPASCIEARYARVWEAVGLNPGKPAVPAKRFVMVLPFRSTRLPLASVTWYPLRDRLG
jgi:hypothetical protein